VLSHHTELGADLAAHAGFTPATVALLRGTGHPRLQAALSTADDTN
jgi:hypothetical protein